jgi:alkylhydroperoxidase/carboxymuconolactone decarboxylase family protein YurZ
LNVKELPPTLRSFIGRYPKVWMANEKLGEECARVGPLSERDVQLIKLAIAGSMSFETSFKTHVKKALRAGCSGAEIEHAIIQLLPILGLSRTMMAMKWYNESRQTRRK